MPQFTTTRRHVDLNNVPNSIQQ